MKPTKFSVAVVLVNPNNEKEVLVVQRPPDDDYIPNIWGLPAATLRGNELPEEIAMRVGKEKLGTEIKPESMLGIKRFDRGEYELILMDIKAKLVGPEPDVKSANTESTVYVDQKWTSDFSILIPGAKQGSLCDRIFLESMGISWE